ncbi:hypothetical protein EHRUM3_05030, partial [Ehrlichia ruminantium]
VTYVCDIKKNNISFILKHKLILRVSLPKYYK